MLRYITLSVKIAEPSLKPFMLILLSVDLFNTELIVFQDLFISFLYLLKIFAKYILFAFLILFLGFHYVLSGLSAK